MNAKCDLFSSILGLAVGFILCIQLKMSCKFYIFLLQKAMIFSRYLPCKARWAALLKLMENNAAQPKQTTVITHSVSLHPVSLTHEYLQSGK